MKGAGLGDDPEAAPGGERGQAAVGGLGGLHAVALGRSQLRPADEHHQWDVGQRATRDDRRRPADRPVAGVRSTLSRPEPAAQDRGEGGRRRRLIMVAKTSGMNRHRPRAAAWMMIVIGGAMAGLWAVLLVQGEVPEIAAGEREIWFHLAVKLLTAVRLLRGLRRCCAGRDLARASLPRSRWGRWPTPRSRARATTRTRDKGAWWPRSSSWRRSAGSRRWRWPPTGRW